MPTSLLHLQLSMLGQLTLLPRNPAPFTRFGKRNAPANLCTPSHGIRRQPALLFTNTPPRCTKPSGKLTFLHVGTTLVYSRELPHLPPASTKKRDRESLHRLSWTMTYFSLQKRSSRCTKPPLARGRNRTLRAVYWPKSSP